MRATPNTPLESVSLTLAAQRQLVIPLLLEKRNIDAKEDESTLRKRFRGYS